MGGRLELQDSRSAVRLMGVGHVRAGAHVAGYGVLVYLCGGGVIASRETGGPAEWLGMRG